MDLRDLVRFYGLDVNRGGFALCPFHNERTPSFKVYRIEVGRDYKVSILFNMTYQQFCDNWNTVNTDITVKV